MFSSDSASSAIEALEEGAQPEQPSDPLPEPTTNLVAPKKKRRRSANAPKTLAGVTGRARTLTFAERVDAWHRHVQGEDVFTLSIFFETSTAKVQEGLDNVALELGYPHNHIDPELERFKIVTAADQFKSSLIKCLQHSNKILADIIGQLDELTQQGKKKFKNLDLIQKKEYSLLMELRQTELKTVASLMAEFRANNAVIAQLTGINKSKPVRKPKQIRTIEEDLENLTDEQLIELTAEEAA